MIHWGSVPSLIVMSLAVMGSPGPATVSLTAAGSAYGIRRCARYLVGVVAGTVIVLVAVATGITVTLLALPALRVILIALSAVYILWLAWHVATSPPLPAEAGATAVPAMVGGLVLGVANPKAWVAIAAVFGSARLADAATTDAVAKVVVLSAMIVLICVTWLVAGVALAGPLRDRRRARLIKIGLAAALVGATVLAILR